MAEEVADPERASWQQEDANAEEDNAEVAQGLGAYADPSQGSIRTTPSSLGLHSPLLSHAGTAVGQPRGRCTVTPLVAEEFSQVLEAVLQIFSSAGGVEIL